MGKLVPKTDTLEILSKVPYAKRLKRQQEEYDKWFKKQEKAKERGKGFQTAMPVTPLEVRYNVSSQMDPDQNPTFELPTPLEKTDTSKIHLYEKIDSMWYRAKYSFGAEPGRPRLMNSSAPGIRVMNIVLRSTQQPSQISIGKVSAKYKQGIRIPQ